MSSVTMNGFTPTEGKIMAILGDGLLHSREELHACLPDELGKRDNLKVHLSNIRKKLNPIGQDIVFVSGGRPCYRLVRFLANPYK